MIFELIYDDGAYRVKIKYESNPLDLTVLNITCNQYFECDLNLFLSYLSSFTLNSTQIVAACDDGIVPYSDKKFWIIVGCAIGVAVLIVLFCSFVVMRYTKVG